jgi:glycerophosphoryl diester phosphodiesterase
MLPAPSQAPTPPLLASLQKASAAGALVVAHRGASEELPENTLAAFRSARAAGAQVVEFDVHQTKDGAWVVMHDETCDRTTDAVVRFGRKGVRLDELSLAQVRELDAGSWRGKQFAGEKVPTLEETLAAIAPAVPMVERKGGDAQALADELRRLGALDKVLVQSFDWEWLAAFRKAAPDCVLGALGGKELTAARLAELGRLGVHFVHWDHRTLRLEDVSALRGKVTWFGVYTVDPDLSLLGAAAFGCDFVTTNRPARLVALRQQGRLARPR